MYLLLSLVLITALLFWWPWLSSLARLAISTEVYSFGFIISTEGWLLFLDIFRDAFLPSFELVVTIEGLKPDLPDFFDVLVALRVSGCGGFDEDRGGLLGVISDLALVDAISCAC